MRDLYHVVNALIPAADAFAGTVYTDIINLKNFEHVSFIVQCGAGGTGTATITVEACDDVSASNVSAIPFTYQACVTGDTFGARTKAAETGFTTAAAANKVYKIEVDTDALLASGYGYVRLKSVEVANDPVTGGIIAILTEPRVEKDIFDTAIV
jgi:hypothetical protein